MNKIIIIFVYAGMLLTSLPASIKATEPTQFIHKDVLALIIRETLAKNIENLGQISSMKVIIDTLNKLKLVNKEWKQIINDHLAQLLINDKTLQAIAQTYGKSIGLDKLTDENTNPYLFESNKSFTTEELKKAAYLAIVALLSSGLQDQEVKNAAYNYIKKYDKNFNILGKLLIWVSTTNSISQNDIAERRDLLKKLIRTYVAVQSTEQATKTILSDDHIRFALIFSPLLRYRDLDYYKFLETIFGKKVLSELIKNTTFMGSSLSAYARIRKLPAIADYFESLTNE